MLFSIIVSGVRWASLVGDVWEGLTGIVRDVGLVGLLRFRQNAAASNTPLWKPAWLLSLLIASRVSRLL